LVESANSALSHDIAMRADVSTPRKARNSERVIKKDLKDRPCYQMRDKGKCEYGDKCIFSHDPRVLKENQALDYAHMVQLQHFANVATVTSIRRKLKLKSQARSLAATIAYKNNQYPNKYDRTKKGHGYPHNTLTKAKPSPYDTQTYQSAVKGVKANLAQHQQQQLVYYAPQAPPSVWQEPPPLSATGQSSIESEDSDAIIDADTGNMTEISSEEEISDDDNSQ
jgi:hypothetical protein